MAKHFEPTITDDSFAWKRNAENTEAEAALDLLRGDNPTYSLSAPYPGAARRAYVAMNATHESRQRGTLQGLPPGGWGTFGLAAMPSCRCLARVSARSDGRRHARTRPLETRT